MTELVVGHSPVVDMRVPEIQTETRGRPPGSRNLPESSTKRDLPKFEHMEQVESLKNKESVCAAVK